LRGRFANQLIQGGFLEYRDAQNLQKGVEGDRHRQFLLDDGREDINRDGHPDLCLHGIFGSPVKRLDPEVLFDPTEEQLDLPAELVKQSDGQGGKGEVVRQERQIAAVVPVVEADATEAIGIRLLGIEAAEDHRLITTQVHGFIHRSRKEARTLQVRLGPDDEERLVLMKSEEAAIIDVAAVEDIKATGFGYEIVQGPHIVRFPVCNLDKRGDRASQIEKGMEFDGRFGATKNGPREKRQTQVDGGRIEGIDRVFEFESQIFAGVKRAGLSDEDLGEVGIDAPIARFVGMSQGVSGDPSAKSHVVETALHGPQTGLDIAKAFAISQLGEGQAEELIETREALDLEVAVVASHASPKFVKGQEAHDLREDGRRGIHRSLLAVFEQKGDNNTKLRSNRLRPKSGVTYSICASSKDLSFQRWDTTDWNYERNASAGTTYV